MKHLCCSNLLSLLLLLFGVTLHASLHEKSAIVYLGEKISYPMVGIHDYIIVDPEKTNVYTHGFQVYKHKMYAQITLKPTSDVKQILGYMEKLHKEGFENFYINAQEQTDKQVVALLNKLSSQSELKDASFLLHPSSTLQISSVAGTFEGIVLYDATDIELLQQKLREFKRFSNTIIDIETSSPDMAQQKKIIKRLQQMGIIGYFTNTAQNIYGYGVKNAVKREILTIIDDSIDDRIVLSAHQYGALPLEYQGYIQSLYDIKQGLPDPEHMTQYAGVVVWLNTEYKFPEKLTEWVKQLHKYHIYVAFADNFGFNIDEMFLQQLGITVKDAEEGVEKSIVTKDPIMDFEVHARPTDETLYFTPPAHSKALITYEDSNGMTSSPAAITPWGGYAISESFMVEIDQENIWVINPFEYFKQALRLKPLPVPDPTTENGSRLFFTHVDGDGYVSYAEFDPQKLAGEILYEEILKKYTFPHSISVIGAEIMPNGLYPELSKRCLEGTKKIYALNNVEAATHTFTHAFFWGKIKNGNLEPQYRLAPKGYKYNLSYEIKGMLDYINDNLLVKKNSKKAKTVFWSGDCAPRLNALELTYKNHILNINGGDTTINNSEPWLSLVAPYGLARGEYYQIYTGQQNENVFTNDWLGPFWGFKKVVQTFKLTDKPRRLKPIDVYYHFNSASKKASLNALRYVFDWVLKQKDIMPIFTSSYIPKVMDYYIVSIAHDRDEWLVSGMRDLKNLRLETPKQHINYAASPTTIGEKSINNRTYIALSPKQQHFFSLQEKQDDETYLLNANAKLVQVIKGNQTTRYVYKGNVDLKLTYHLNKECSLQTKPKAKKVKTTDDILQLIFPKNTHKGIVDVRCR